MVDWGAAPSHRKSRRILLGSWTCPSHGTQRMVDSQRERQANCQYLRRECRDREKMKSGLCATDTTEQYPAARQLCPFVTPASPFFRVLGPLVLRATLAIDDRSHLDRFVVKPRNGLRPVRGSHNPPPSLPIPTDPYRITRKFAK